MLLLVGRACHHTRYPSWAHCWGHCLTNVWLSSPPSGAGVTLVWYLNLLGLLAHYQVHGTTLDGIWIRAYWRRQVHKTKTKQNIGVGFICQKIILVYYRRGSAATQDYSRLSWMRQIRRNSWGGWCGFNKVCKGLLWEGTWSWGLARWTVSSGNMRVGGKIKC